MKNPRLLLAACVFAAPLLFRAFWFYQGVYRPAPEASIPDFSDSTLVFPGLSTPIASPAGSAGTGRIVLIDRSHGNLFNLSEIDSLVGAVQDLGARWEFLDVEEDLDSSLKRAESFVVIAPSSPFTDQEIEDLRGFVQRGGRLLVITDPTREYGYYDSSSNSGTSSSFSITSSAAANLLIEPYGISVASDYLYNLVNNEGNFRHVAFSGFSGSPLAAGLEQVVFYSAHSVRSEGGSLILADDNTYSSLTDGGGSLAAAAEGGGGNVAALGDLTFLASPYAQVADNQLFIRNLAAFLAEKSRPARLEDFPHVFTRDLVVIQDPETGMSTGTIALTADLQDRLLKDGIRVDLNGKPKSGKDLLVIASFPPAEEIEEMIGSFGIRFDVEKPPDGSDQDSSPDNGEEPAEEDASPGSVADAAPTAELDDSRPPDDAEPAAGTSTSGGPDEVDSSSAKADLFSSFDFFDGLENPENGGTMDVPGFGEVSMDGVSLILFNPSAGQNALYLLADGDEALQNLLQRLVIGDLSGCLIKNNIAVCGSAARG